MNDSYRTSIDTYTVTVFTVQVVQVLRKGVSFCHLTLGTV